MQDEFSVVVWNEVQPRADEEAAYQREMEAYRALEVSSPLLVSFVPLLHNEKRSSNGRRVS